MKTFGEYLIEGPPAPGSQLFHRDIGIPSQVGRPPVGLALQYGVHAKKAALADGLTGAPKHLPNNNELIEVETLHGRSTKWVVRFPLPNDPRDLVIVVLPDGFVKTCWCNDRGDTHKTLKRSLYTLPAQYHT